MCLAEGMNVRLILHTTGALWFLAVASQQLHAKKTFLVQEEEVMRTVQSVVDLLLKGELDGATV